MMNLELSIKGAISDAFSSLFNHSIAISDIQLQPTRKEFEGTYTFVTFPYGKISGKNPEETGRILGQHLADNSKVVGGFNVVKGFLNLVVDDSVWMKLFNEIAQSATVGQAPANGQKVMVEYSSPNTNKPLHLGHMRNNFLGFSLAEILKAAGYDVVKANLVNDRGIHICKSMLAYQQFGQGETPESAGMKGDHLIGKYYVIFDKEYKKEIEALKGTGISEDEAKKEAPLMKGAQEMLQKWEQGDAEVRNLWQTMNGWVYDGFKQTYQKMGVSFDQYYFESDTYLLGKDIIEEGLEKGVFFRKDDGSVWIDLTDEGMDQKLVLRSDGTSVYMTQDLGTADLKYNDFKIDKSVYVVGNEQDYHFKVLFSIMKRLGRPYADGLYHLSYGMVDLPSGKMKSREGTVVDADDLMAEMEATAERHTTELGKIEGFNEEEARKLYYTLSMGALKYFLLKVDPKKRMLFNPEESIEFQGNTGPFIQYTHARIAAILRRAEQLSISGIADTYEGYHLQRVEQEVVYMLAEYPKRIQEAAQQFSPATIAQYAYDLAKEYNRFYTELTIFNDPDPKAVSFRVGFSAQVAKTIRHAMRLLGIDVPERM
jgi:arginyl-tRNA synthetase